MNMSQRKRVELEYDLSDGGIYDAAGSCLCFWAGLNPFSESESPLDLVNKESGSNRDKIDQLTQLKLSGYETKDVIELKEAGLL